MTPLIFILIAVAGGLGASARLVVDGFARARFATDFPIGTAIVNASGSFLLGAVTGLAIGQVLPEEVRLIAGVGFLGGYTTFSTASFETVRLIQGGRYGAALLNGVGVLLVCVLASTLGLWLGSLP